MHTHWVPTGREKNGLSMVLENGPAVGAQIAISRWPPVGVTVAPGVDVDGDAVDVPGGGVDVGCETDVDVAVAGSAAVAVGAGPSPLSLPQPAAQRTNAARVNEHACDRPFIAIPPFRARESQCARRARIATPPLRHAASLQAVAKRVGG